MARFAMKNSETSTSMLADKVTNVMSTRAEVPSWATPASCTSVASPASTQHPPHAPRRNPGIRQGTSPAFEGNISFRSTGDPDMTATLIGMPSAPDSTGGWRTPSPSPKDCPPLGSHRFPGAHKTRPTRRCAATGPRHPHDPLPARPARRGNAGLGGPAQRRRSRQVRSLRACPKLLEEFERNVTATAASSHWARDKHGPTHRLPDVEKSKSRASRGRQVKSIATQGDQPQRYLKDPGRNRRSETDLAEMIVQLTDNMPNHIVVPAIHRNRSEVAVSS